MQEARAAQKKREAEEYRAKMERAEQRAAAPVFKRTGKPKMTRSKVQQRRLANTEGKAVNKEELELQHYIERSFP